MAYNVPGVPIYFKDRDPDRPRRMACMYTNQGRPASISFYLDYERGKNAPLEQRPGEHLDSIFHEEAHVVQDTILADPKLRERFPAASSYLGFSWAVTSSPKLSSLYTDPDLYLLMPSEQDAWEATRALEPFWSYVETMAKGNIVEVPRW